MPDNLADCCVTDPPYGISFMAKKWDYQIPSVAVWSEVLRVLKPGAHLLCACGTRTQHRMAVNIEDAGFEIRDVICWHYGTGFPKSMDISKAFDKQAGAEREIIGGKNNTYDGAKRNPEKHKSPADLSRIGKWGLKKSPHGLPVTSPFTEAAKLWNGWGTALKPATEFWTLARKPLGEKTVTANLLKYGTGAINIDSCRIDLEGEKPPTGSAKRIFVSNEYAKDKVYGNNKETSALGRFPANLILDEFMAEELDKQSGLLVSGKPSGVRKAPNKVYGQYAPGQEVTGYGDAGGASRFFYVAKTDSMERGPGNSHPTVKPLALMHYLIKLICPLEAGRIVVDPFAGSGTTCIARRGFSVSTLSHSSFMRNI